MKPAYTALLIVAHGSTVNPDSSASTLTHAATIRRRNVFADVACAFWKEEPSLRDAIFLFEPESVREVCVVPNFISEGYFTQTVIPRELELNSRITERSNGQKMRYFGGLTMEEISEVLKIHVNTVMRDWRVARAWLMAALSGEDMDVI